MGSNGKSRVCYRCKKEFHPERPSLMSCPDCSQYLYGRITEEALYDPRLTSEEKLVLVECDRRGWCNCTPSAKNMSVRLNMNVKTVRKALKSLEKIGYISIELRDGVSSLITYLHTRFWKEDTKGHIYNPTHQTGIPTTGYTHAAGTPPYPPGGYTPTHGVGTPLPTGRVPKQSKERVKREKGSESPPLRNDEPAPPQRSATPLADIFRDMQEPD